VNIRDPLFAYQGWYPSSEGACRQAIDEYLASFSGSPEGTLAGIVPHAGWVYSGRLAALTFAALAKVEPQVVFLFGGHMHPGQKCVCMPSGAFGTPLGPVVVHEKLASELSEHLGCVTESPNNASPDNTIELQMPIIRAVWPQAKVVALAVAPDEQAERAGNWAAQAASDNQLSAVAIGSTDLTHYGSNYGFSPKGSGQEALEWSKNENDRPFIDRLLVLDAQGAIQHAQANHSACCPGAAAAAMAFARAGGVKEGKLIEHTTSHEVEGRGTPSMWVGYASIAY
jgi:AmmeMemoRadiSam system protein B